MQPTQQVDELELQRAAEGSKSRPGSPNERTWASSRRVIIAMVVVVIADTFPGLSHWVMRPVPDVPGDA